MNMEKIRNTFSDEAFLNALLELETAAEVQTALQEKGIEVTEDGELSEDALEQVSGGIAVAVAIGGAIGIVGLAACVFGAGVAVDNLVVRFTNRHW